MDLSSAGSFVLDEPAAAGQGFWFTPIPAQNRVVGSWYTYTADGSPTWFTFQSENAGFDGVTATTTLYQSTGATEHAAQMNVPVGTIDFNVVDCSLIEATVTMGAIVTHYDGVRLTSTALCPPLY